jgi:hypothetical protein
MGNQKRGARQVVQRTVLALRARPAAEPRRWASESLNENAMSRKGPIKRSDEGVRRATGRDRDE